jgi:hypothetical protein
MPDARHWPDIEIIVALSPFTRMRHNNFPIGNSKSPLHKIYKLIISYRYKRSCKALPFTRGSASGKSVFSDCIRATSWLWQRPFSTFGMTNPGDIPSAREVQTMKGTLRGSNDLADTCFENGLPSIKLSAREEYGNRLPIRTRAVRRDSRERTAAHACTRGNARYFASR